MSDFPASEVSERSGLSPGSTQHPVTSVHYFNAQSKQKYAKVWTKIHYIYSGPWDSGNFDFTFTFSTLNLYLCNLYSSVEFEGAAHV